MAKLLSEVRAEARSLFNEPDPNNSHITDAQLNGWANEAIRYILSKTQTVPLKERDYTSALSDISVNQKTLTIGQAFIVDPNTDEYVELQIVDATYLHNVSESWLTDAVGVPAYFARKDFFTYYLYPQPVPGWVGQNIRTYGMEFPATITGDSTTAGDPNTINLPDNLQDVLSHFCAYRAFSQLGMHDKAGLELEFFRSQIKSQRDISTIGSQQNSEFKIVETDDI